MILLCGSDSYLPQFTIISRSTVPYLSNMLVGNTVHYKVLVFGGRLWNLSFAPVHLSQFLETDAYIYIFLALSVIADILDNLSYNFLYSLTCLSLLLCCSQHQTLYWYNPYPIIQINMELLQLISSIDWITEWGAENKALLYLKTKEDYLTLSDFCLQYI